MREHAGVTREELKQSAAITMTVLLGLGLLAAWSVLIPGVDAWENIVVAVIGSLKLTGPVAAAFAAWVAVRKRRALRGRDVSARIALKTPLAIVAVVGLSYIATVLVLAVKTLLTEQSGRLSMAGLGMGLAGLALYTVLGWVVGWLLPYRATALAAGVGCYALFTWIGADTTWAVRLVPGTGKPYDLFQGLNGAAFPDQTIWLVGITLTILLSWAAVVTRQALVLAFALVSVLGAGTGVARLLTEPGLATNQPIAYSCQQWPITVCVHPGMRAGLSELGASFTKMASRLSGTPAAFTRVEQRPLGDVLQASTGMVPIHVADLSAGFADQAAYEYLETLAAKCGDSPASGYREIVMAWLRGEPLPGGPLPEHQYAASWFSGLSEHQRRDWLRMNYGEFQNCRLSSRYFGDGQVAIRRGPPAGQASQAYPVYPTNSGQMTKGSEVFHGGESVKGAQVSRGGESVRGLPASRDGEFAGGLPASRVGDPLRVPQVPRDGDVTRGLRVPGGDEITKRAQRSGGEYGFGEYGIGEYGIRGGYGLRGGEPARIGQSSRAGRASTGGQELRGGRDPRLGRPSLPGRDSRLGQLGRGLEMSPRKGR